ncbi:FRG domain-containing protein [Bacillus cereus]|uniref:FRG domain-containing protein n=1 Tax=Bacillus cereus TaxID=1396 RepID=UPI0018F28115|nr:FRG domain-containing protein [Bacillus cereus]MCU4844515.1 FRG domain-containing protein [Bacillus cereus]
MSFSKEWIEILDEVSEFTNNSKKQRVWFRGHNDINYNLNSGLFRLNLGNDIEAYKETERSAYNNFLNYSPTLLEKDSWDLLYIMQHHGLRTRLLDWTESFAISLHFALNTWKYNKKDACIWMLDPIKLNEKAVGRSTVLFPKKEFKYPDEFLIKETDNSLAITPIKNNTRIIAQKGFFTLQGNLLQPLEEEFNGELLNENILKKITLKKTILNDANKFLKICGIDEFVIFPDLEGLAKSINKKMENKQHSKALIYT